MASAVRVCYAGAVKITNIETLCFSRMHEPERQWVTAVYRTVKADCVVVRIHTDEGLAGIGEASAYGGPVRIGEWVEWLGRQMIGREVEDPLIVPHPNAMARAHDAAVAGIDCALWDLRGKIAGKRVCDLLTDAPLDRVRVYASGGCRYDWRLKPEQLIEEAREYIDQGFTAMKFRIGTQWDWDGVTVERFLGLVRELAADVAGRLELMLDGNCRLTEHQALLVARELDRLGFTWFEEPCPSGDIDVYARLCAEVSMPITGGESLTTLEQFRPYFEKKAYDIVQQDAGLCGITETMRIADMATRYGVDVCPHSWHNGVMAMANAHVVASLPNPRVLEICQHQGPLQWGIVEDPPQIVDGYLVLPQRPGLGIDLHPEAHLRFPFIEGHYAIQVER